MLSVIRITITLTTVAFNSQKTRRKCSCSPLQSIALYNTHSNYILLINNVFPKAICNIFTFVVCRYEQPFLWSQVTLTPSLPFVPCLQAAAIFKVLLLHPLGSNIQWRLTQCLSLLVTGHLYQTTDIRWDSHYTRRAEQSLTANNNLLFWHFSHAPVAIFSQVSSFPGNGLYCGSLLELNADNWFFK